MLLFYFCSFCVAVFFCPFSCLAFSCAFLLTLSNLDVSIVAKSFSFYAIKRGFFLRLSRSLAIFLSALLGFVCFSFGAIEKSIWACVCVCVYEYLFGKNVIFAAFSSPRHLHFNIVPNGRKKVPILRHCMYMYSLSIDTLTYQNDNVTLRSPNKKSTSSTRQ